MRRAELMHEDVEAEVEAVSMLWKRRAALRELVASLRRSISETAEYFDLFFSLLSSSSHVVVAEAWSLIQALPVNETVSAGISTLNGALCSNSDPSFVTAISEAEWAVMFDPSSPLKLLYSLQIVTKLLDDIEAPVREAAEGAAGSTVDSVAVAGSEAALKSEWALAFVRLGGLAHLASVLLTIDLNALIPAMVAGDDTSGESSSLTMQCLLLLLRTFSRFVVVVSNDVDHVGFGGWRAFDSSSVDTAPVPQRPAFVHRMLEVASTLSAMSLPSSPVEGGFSPAPPSLTLHRSTSASSGKGGPASPSKRPQTSRVAGNESVAEGPIAARAHDDDGFGLNDFFGADDDADFMPVVAEADTGAAKNDADAPESALAGIMRHAMSEIFAAALLGPVVSPEMNSTVEVEMGCGPSALDALQSFPDIRNVLALAFLAPTDSKVRIAFGTAITRICAAEAASVQDTDALPVVDFLLESLLSRVTLAYAFVPLNSLCFFFVIEKLLAVSLECWGILFGRFLSLLCNPT